MEVTEIEGCSFVHANGFVGGAANMDAALAMARKAIDLSRSAED